MLNVLLLWRMKATFSSIKYSNFTTTEHKSPRVVKLQIWCADLANPLTMPPALYSLRLFICINHFPDVSTAGFYWNLLSMASVCFCPIQFHSCSKLFCSHTIGQCVEDFSNLPRQSENYFHLFLFNWIHVPNPVIRCCLVAVKRARALRFLVGRSERHREGGYNASRVFVWTAEKCMALQPPGRRRRQIIERNHFGNLLVTGAEQNLP